MINSDHRLLNGKNPELQINAQFGKASTRNNSWLI